MKRLPYVACAAILMAEYALGIGALAQQPIYPSKPVRIIVPYAPGGGADIVARVVALWNTEVAKLLRTADMQERLTSAGIEPAGGPPAQFRDALKTDIERWQKVVKAANIKASD